MQNYALVRNTDYDDSGNASKIKSDALTDQIGAERSKSPTKNPVNQMTHGVLMGDTGLENHSGTRGFYSFDTSAPPKAPRFDVSTGKGPSSSRQISGHTQPKQDLATICNEMHDDSIAYINSRWELLPDNIKQTILTLTRVFETKNETSKQSSHEQS